MSSMVGDVQLPDDAKQRLVQRMLVIPAPEPLHGKASTSDGEYLGMIQLNNNRTEANGHGGKILDSGDKVCS